MKTKFSEYRSDYSHYLFPYVIWGFPEHDETPADGFEQGFLPGNRELTRFYMCRHTRVDLRQFKSSSENRRILRKGSGITSRLIPAEEFRYTEKWSAFCKSYAEVKFGPGVMTDERLDSLFSSPVCSHILQYQEEATGRDVGLVVYYMQQPRMGFYYYAFYDLEMFSRSPGIFMMTTSVQLLQEMGFDYIYLGSCYSRSALYKTQFKGFEFWNGFRWSEDIAELKYLIKRDEGKVHQHLLETPKFLESFYPDGVEG